MRSVYTYNIINSDEKFKQLQRILNYIYVIIYTIFTIEN